MEKIFDEHVILLKDEVIPFCEVTRISLVDHYDLELVNKNNEKYYRTVFFFYVRTKKKDSKLTFFGKKTKHGKSKSCSCIKSDKKLRKKVKRLRNKIFSMYISMFASVFDVCEEMQKKNKKYNPSKTELSDKYE